MRASLLLLVVLGACAVADPSPPASDGMAVESLSESSGTTELSNDVPADESVDVCALASALPADDICSLVCDPAAMKAQLLADGSEPGTCIQLYCQLNETVHVLAGVCLTPQ